MKDKCCELMKQGNYDSISNISMLIDKRNSKVQNLNEMQKKMS